MHISLFFWTRAGNIKCLFFFLFESASVSFILPRLSHEKVIKEDQGGSALGWTKEKKNTIEMLSCKAAMKKTTKKPF